MITPKSDAATDQSVVLQLARWIAATLCILYGFAKLNGSQFTVLNSELTKPLGEVSGFWLTWYYFSYSAAYGTAIAVLQIFAGVLLVVPRTGLLGALVLLPVAINIVLIDVFFGVDIGGTFAAVVLFMCVCAMIAPYVPRLRRAILLDAAPTRPTTGATLGLCIVIVGAFAFTWWTANYNNRAPTELDGVWTVIGQSRAEASAPRWQTVFFERNRAELVVFRTIDGVDTQHDFSVKNGHVRVWQTWLKKGALVMEGDQLPDGRLRFDVMPSSGGGKLLLQRAKPDRQGAR